MSDFEHELLDALERNGKFDGAREELLRLQVTSEFRRKRRRLLIWAWVFQAISLAILVPGVILVFGPGDTRALVRGVALVVMGEAGLIVIKLWYWIVHARLEIIREIKRMELRLMQPEHAQAGGPAGTPPV